MFNGWVLGDFRNSLCLYLVAVGYPDKLTAAVVPILPPHVCKKLYKGSLTASMFCAGYIAGKVDTCKGDSGGPVVCRVNGRLPPLRSIMLQFFFF